MCIELKALSKKDDLSKLIIVKVDWDIVINKIPQQLVKIKGRAHGEGGEYGINEYYVYPLNEEMTVDNLTPYWGIKGGVAWGIYFEYKNSFIHGNGFHKNDQIRENGRCWITRNGEKFCEVPGRKHEYALAKAQTLLIELEECSIPIFSRNWEEKIIGRKIWYYNQPAIVERICDGQGAMILIPDGINKFEPQPWQVDEDETKEEWIMECGSCVKVDLLSSSIWWFRK